MNNSLKCNKIFQDKSQTEDSFQDRKNTVSYMSSEMNLGGGGTPQNFWSFMSPPQGVFYCFFKKEFSEISKIWSFMSGNFFPKIPQNFQKISWNFLNFFKTEKNYYFCNQISPIWLYWSKFAQIFP